INVSAAPFFFSFNGPAPPEIYTLSLHDALPISPPDSCGASRSVWPVRRSRFSSSVASSWPASSAPSPRAARSSGFRPCPEPWPRSEEHTSELQSRFDLVCRLLLEKKNKILSTHY